MFGKKEEVNFDKFDTLIGKDSVFEGNLKVTGALRVEGFIKGEVVCSGDLVISESGKIEGNIDARNLLVAGTINGFTQASGKIEIAGSGKVYGDIAVKGIIIEDGAIFQGKCLMDKIEKGAKPEINQVS